MTAESDWATFRDQGGVTAKRAFMAGREAGYWEGTRAEIEAVYVTDITEASIPPRPRLHAIRAALNVWTAVAMGFTWLLLGVVQLAHPHPVVGGMFGVLGLLGLFTLTVACNDDPDDEAAIALGVLVTICIVVLLATGYGLGWVVWGGGV